MDILAALTEIGPTRTNRRCKIGRWLDSIPAETAGREQLVAALETTDPNSEFYRALDRLDALTSTLGFDTSIKTIGDHRGGRCRCFR